jgi:hypothetical protein
MEAYYRIQTCIITHQSEEFRDQIDIQCDINLVQILPRVNEPREIEHRLRRKIIAP